MIFTLRTPESVAYLCRLQASAWFFEASAALSRGAFQAQLIEQAADAWNDATGIEPQFTN